MQLILLKKFNIFHHQKKGGIKLASSGVILNPSAQVYLFFFNSQFLFRFTKAILKGAQCLEWKRIQDLLTQLQVLP